MAEAANGNGPDRAEYERQLFEYDEALRNRATSDVTEMDMPPNSEAFQTAKVCIDLMHRVWHVTDTADDGSDETAYAEDNKGDARIVREHDVLRKIGRFEIIRELGRGGLGVVFLANDPRLGRHVALKVPRPEALLNHDARRRFLIEGEIAARLRHPGIVSVYEVGEDGPVCFIAAEFSDGMTLGEWMSAPRSPVPTDQAARIVADLAGAVAHAHGRGVIHRDIKPGNVMLEDGVLNDGSGNRVTVKLTDFGTAKLLKTDEHVTRTGALIGTAAYMAPEQATGRIRDIDVRTDIHALGAVLYELLTGSGPFAAENEAASLRRVVEDEPTRPRKMRPDVPRDLEAICLKCLNKKQGNRYATAYDLGQDLERFLRREPTVARPVSTLERAGRLARRRPVLALLSTLLTAGLFVFVAVVIHYNDRLTDQLAITTAARDDAEQSAHELRQQVYAADMRRAMEAWQADDYPLMRDLLDRYQPEPSEPDLRSFAWRFLARRDDPSLLTLSGHMGDAFGVAYAPDGKLLASCGKDGSVRFWDRNTGKPAKQPASYRHPGEVTAVCFSPHGSFVASVAEAGTLALLRLGEPAPHPEFVQLSELSLYAIAISPDGKLLAAGEEHGNIFLVDTATLEVRHFAKPFEKDVRGLDFSPDGSRLAACGDASQVFEFDVHLATPVNQADLTKGPYDTHYNNSIEYSRDGRSLLVAARQERRTFLWSPKAETTTVVHTQQPEVLTDAVFAPDRKTAFTACKDGVLRVINLADGEVQSSLLGHDGRVWDLALSPDGRELASAGADGTVKIWDLAEVANRHQRLIGHPGFHDLDTAADRLVANRRIHTHWQLDHNLVTWDLSTGKLLLSSGQDFATELAGPETQRLYGDRSMPLIAISPNGRFVAVYDRFAEEGTEIWDVDAQQRVWTLPVAPSAAAFTIDNARLLTVHASGMDVWDVSSGGRLRTIKEDMDNSENNLALSADGRLCAMELSHSQIGIWDVTECSQVSEFSLTATPHDWAFIPQQDSLAVSTSDGRITLYDVRSGDVRGRLHGHSGTGASNVNFAVSPDGRTLVSVSQVSNSVRLWDLTTRQLIGHFDVDQPVRIAWSADGDWIFCRSGDGTGSMSTTLHAWSAANPRAGQLSRLEYPVSFVVKRPAGVVDVATESTTTEVFLSRFESDEILVAQEDTRLTGGFDIQPVGRLADLGSDRARFTGNLALQRGTAPIVLMLDDLPDHTHINIGFVLAVVDDWNGLATPPAGPDIFCIEVDGQHVFTAAFANRPDGLEHFQVADVPRDAVLWPWWRGNLGWGPHGDAVYDMSHVPALQAIPHTGDSVTISLSAQGLGHLQDDDQSWAIDDLHVTLQSSSPLTSD